jgi:hypothetical protein
MDATLLVLSSDAVLPSLCFDYELTMETPAGIVTSRM